MAQKPGAKFEWSRVSNEIHSGICHLWQEDSCTDFEVKVENESFRCHRVVLAAVSDYFKALFSSGMKETEKNEVTLEDVRPESFSTIIKLLYEKNKKNPLKNKSEDSLIDLLKLGDRLQMKFLRTICLENLENTMSSRNCISRWKQGEQIMCKQLETIGRTFIRENFEELVEDHLLVSLEVEDFIDIISDDGMHVKRENLIWTAIKEWVYFDKDKRSGYMADLIQECCLTEIDREELIEKIAFDPVVRHSDFASNRLLEIVRYQRHPSTHGNIEVKFRNCHERKQCLLVFFSECRKDPDDFPIPHAPTTFKGVVVLKDNLQRIGELQSRYRNVPRFNGELSCCTYGNYVYVLFGDRRQRSQLWVYDNASKTWNSKTEMEMPLIGSTMACTDGCLFVAGGKSGLQMNAQVWQYNIDSDSWFLDGEILAPVENPSSVALEDRIYIFGGKLQGNVPADSVQVYDTRTKEATILTNLPKPCAWSRAVIRGETAVVVSDEGDIVKINLMSSEASVVASLHNFRRINYGIRLKRNILDIFGGQVPDNPERSPKNTVSLDGDSDKQSLESMKNISVNMNDGTVTDLVETPLAGLPSNNIVGCVSVVLQPESWD